MKYFIILITSILFSLNSFSAIDMYLKLNDGTQLMAGESRDSKHVGWIDVLAYTDGANNKIVNGQTSKALANEFSCTIYLDKALNQLRKALFIGSHFSNVQFEFVIAGQLYEQIYMEAVVVTSITGGLNGGQDRGTINISFCPARFRYTYYYYNAGGGVTGNNIFGWDVQQNTAW